MENSFKSIRGNSYGMWIGTEINLHAKSFVKEAMNRTIAADKRKVFWDLNPDNPKAWIYTDFIDKYAADTKAGAFVGGYNYEHFTIDDNVNISDERKAEVKSQYDITSLWYKRDILGLRIAAEGLIFQSFANNPENYTLTVSELDKNRITSIQIGIDFGGNKSKTTFVATAYIDGFKKLIVIADHKIDSGKGEVSPEIINTDFIRFVKTLYQRYNPILIKFAWADNENQAVISLGFLSVSLLLSIRLKITAEWAVLFLLTR